VIGGNLTVRLVVGEHTPSGAPPLDDVSPPESEPVADVVDIDLEADRGQVMGSDADTRAVADLAAREFGGVVIEED